MVRDETATWTEVPTLYLPSLLGIATQTSSVVEPVSSAGLISVSLPLTGVFFSRDGHRRLVAQLECGCLFRGEMDLCDQSGYIHHGDDGLAGVGHLAGEQRPIRDHAVDGRTDLGVTESRLRRLVLALRRLARAFRVLDGGGLAHGVQRVQVLFGDIEGGLGLHEAGLGGLEIAARNGSLLQTDSREH